MKIISKISALWHTFKLKTKPIIRDDITSIVTPTSQEDQRDRKVRKRIVQAIDAQEQQMNAMALKQHGSSCGIFDCKKKSCFKRVPDKIAGTSVIGKDDLDNQMSLAKKRMQRNLEILKKKDL